MKAVKTANRGSSLEAMVNECNGIRNSYSKPIAANTAAKKPGPKPPNQPLSSTAQENNETGAPTKCASIHRPAPSATPTASTATAYLTAAGGLDHHPVDRRVIRLC